MKYLLPLHSRNRTRQQLTGGKGASLQKLCRFGHNVPPGFILTSEAFGDFIAINSLAKEMKTGLRGIRSPEEITRASMSIRGMIMNAAIPLSIINEVEAGLRRLHGRKFAVRSSASVEDSRQHSWAGQFDSFLDVRKREVTKLVRKCWASFFNSRAISYRPQVYKRIDDLRLAVIVQEMVPSDFAGVIFSTDPTDRNSHRMLLEAVAGHGDGLVSGRKQSFTATLNKPNGQVISSSSADQDGHQPLLSASQLRLIYQRRSEWRRSLSSQLISSGRS